MSRVPPRPGGTSMDDATRRKLVERLVKRLSGIWDLYGKKVLNEEILGRQLFQLVSTKDAWQLACSVTDDEREARRLLMRLQDPEAWRSDSSESEERRRALLEERLIRAFKDASPPGERTLETMIDTACLPHFVGFVRDRAGAREAPKSSGGRVKVLD